MGWKNVKEAYKIGHSVHIVKGKGLCIGSPYIHDIIVISLEGKVIKPYHDRGNESLNRYMEEFTADPEKLRELVCSEDHFENSITVFTYNGGEIIEQKCEKLGYPNVTHDGEKMYENSHSPDRAQVIQWAKRNASASIEAFERRLNEIREQLVEFQGYLKTAEADLATLEALTP